MAFDQGFEWVVTVTMDCMTLVAVLVAYIIGRDVVRLVNWSQNGKST